MSPPTATHVDVQRELRALERRRKQLHKALQALEQAHRIVSHHEAFDLRREPETPSGR